MKCFVSPVFVLSYVGIVFVGVNCAQLSCHSCATLLTSQTAPNCNRTVKYCNNQNSFCGILLLYKNNTGVIYQETCVSHHVCINTTAGCPKKSCFLYCCPDGLCNKYDQVNQIIDKSLASIIKEHSNMVPTEPMSTMATKTIIINIRETTRSTSLASLLKCSRLTMVLLLTVILKDYV